jgi:hypothetical protein
MESLCDIEFAPLRVSSEPHENIDFTEYILVATSDKMAYRYPKYIQMPCEPSTSIDDSTHIVKRAILPPADGTHYVVSRQIITRFFKSLYNEMCCMEETDKPEIIIQIFNDDNISYFDVGTNGNTLGVILLFAQEHITEPIFNFAPNQKFKASDSFETFCNMLSLRDKKFVKSKLIPNPNLYFDTVIACVNLMERIIPRIETDEEKNDYLKIYNFFCLCIASIHESKTAKELATIFHIKNDMTKEEYKNALEMAEYIVTDDIEIRETYP